MNAAPEALGVLGMDWVQYGLFEPQPQPGIALIGLEAVVLSPCSFSAPFPQVRFLGLLHGLSLFPSSSRVSRHG